jgi:hypothetical protein
MRGTEVGESVSRSVGKDVGIAGRRSDSASGNGRLDSEERTARLRTARLRRAIGNLRGAGEEGRQGREREHAEPVDLTPKSAHEAITRQMVTDLAADVAEVKTRVNAVLWLLAGAVAVDVVMRLAGVG